MCILCAYMLPDASFILMENVKQEAQLYQQKYFNRESKIKNAYLDLIGKLVSIGKMTLYVFYLGCLNP